MKTEEKSASNKKLISLCVIERALEGDIQAINKVLKHYEGYIAKLSILQQENHEKYSISAGFHQFFGLQSVFPRQIYSYMANQALPPLLHGHCLHHPDRG